MNDAHLTEGTLRAFLDQELSKLGSLRCAWHLRGCAACRVALDNERALGLRTAVLLSAATRPVDAEEGWHRLMALSVGVPARDRRLARVAVTVGLVALVVGGALAVAWSRTRDDVGSAHASTMAKDACCWDLDGGGRGDDGVFTLSRSGEVVECVVLYDDVDRSGTLSDADVIRYVSHRRACGLAPSADLPMPSSGDAFAAVTSIVLDGGGGG